MDGRKFSAPCELAAGVQWLSGGCGFVFSVARVGSYRPSGLTSASLQAIAGHAVPSRAFSELPPNIFARPPSITKWEIMKRPRIMRGSHSGVTWAAEHKNNVARPYAKQHS
jgi:hypothetical protein